MGHAFKNFHFGGLISVSQKKYRVKKVTYFKNDAEEHNDRTQGF